MSKNVGPVAKMAVATTLSFGAIGAVAGGLVDYLATEGIHKTWVKEDEVTTYGYGDALEAVATAEEDLAETEKVADESMDDLLDENA